MKNERAHNLLSSGPRKLMPFLCAKYIHVISVALEVLTHFSINSNSKVSSNHLNQV